MSSGVYLTSRARPRNISQPARRTKPPLLGRMLSPLLLLGTAALGCQGDPGTYFPHCENISHADLDPALIPPRVNVLLNSQNEPKGVETLEALLSEYSGLMTIAQKDALFEKVFKCYHYNGVVPQNFSDIYGFDDYDTDGESTRVYLRNLTNSLWVRQSSENFNTPWLATAEFDDPLILEQRIRKEHFPPSAVEGSRYYDANWSYSKIAREVYKVTPVALSTIRGTGNQEEGIARILNFTANNLFHTNYIWDSSVYEGKRFLDGGFSVEPVFNERVVGCHHASKVAAALMRSVNIPAFYRFNEEKHGIAVIAPRESGSSARQYYFVHGDWLADYMGVPGELLMMETESPEYYDWQEPHGLHICQDLDCGPLKEIFGLPLTVYPYGIPIWGPWRGPITENVELDPSEYPENHETINDRALYAYIYIGVPEAPYGTLYPDRDTMIVNWNYISQVLLPGYSFPPPSDWPSPPSDKDHINLVSFGTRIKAIDDYLADF